MPNFATRPLARVIAGALLAIPTLIALGASPAPPVAAAGPVAAQVSTEVQQFQQFMLSLARAPGNKGPYRLSLKPKILAADGQYTLDDADREHIKKHSEVADTSRFIAVLGPPRREVLRRVFGDMQVAQPAPPGVTDRSVIEFEARRQIDRWTNALADSLGEVKKALDDRQRQVGRKDEIPVLERPPSLAAGAAPSPRQPPPPAGQSPLQVAPPPVAQVVDPDPLDTTPCADMAREVKMLKRETQNKLGPIRELVAAADRALVKRYFEEAREAYERAVEASDDLEKKWHKLLTDMVSGVSTEERFRAECTRIISESLSQAIAMKDLCRDIYPRLGRAYFALEKYDQAAIQTRRSITIDPTDARTWDQLGQAEFKREQYDRAVEAFAKSAQFDSYQPEVWMRLARSYAKKGEVKQSLIYLRRAISRGFLRFEEVAEDPDFTALQGDRDFEELIFMAPGVPY